MGEIWGRYGVGVGVGARVRASVRAGLRMMCHVVGGLDEGDIGEIYGRYRGDLGVTSLAVSTKEISGRYRGDIGEIYGRCRGDVGEM